MNPLVSLLARNGYLPHGYCFSWTPDLLWSMVGADSLIALSYMAIPLAIARYVRRRRDPKIKHLALLFGAFILACGTTHLMDVWTIWVPDYGLQSLTKGVTALISVATAVALWRLVPIALTAPTTAQLQASISQLESEVRARHTAEESLRDAQDQLAVTLASIGAGFVATDPSGRITHLNEVAQGLLGWDEREARGEILWNVFVREGRPAADLALNPVDVYLRENVRVESSYDVVLRSRDGSTTPVRVKAAVTRGDRGQPRSIALVLRDRSGEIAAEAVAARLAAIVESSGDAIIGKSLQGVITSWNPGAQALFGYSAEEAVGQPIKMLIPTERVSEEDMILARIQRGERVDHFETVRRRKDGTLVHVSASISPVLNSAGEVVGASKIARDFTEHRQGELRLMTQLQRLRLLDEITRAIGERLDMASVHQVAVRSLADELPTDLCCVLTHHAEEGTLEVTSVSDASAAPFLAISAVVTPDGNGLSRCLRGELVHESDLASVEFPFARLLVNAGFRSLVVAPLRSEDHVFGVLLAARHAPDAFSSGDCEFIRQLSAHVALASRQAKLHGQLQSAFDELSRSQQAALQQERLRALGQMASGIAHDINNALSPAVLYAESLLAHEPMSDRGRKQLEQVAHAVDDVAATVARLREFYRSVEPQKLSQPLALNPLVRSVLDLSHARWSDMPQERGVVIDVVTELDPALPPVWAIESEIRDALVNLVFNAIDAMPDGGTLVLRTRRLPAQAIDKDGNEFPARVAVDVADTGVGMDAITRQRCLEPFFTTKGDRGTGLGLAMVYGAAKRHGIEIKIHSQPGLGSTFTLLFPLGPLAPEAVAPLPGVAAIRPIRILLIDDDPALLRSMRDTLEADGHTLAMADGGRAGIEHFMRSVESGQPFQLVITDLGMPRVDGRGVAAEIKRASPTTPVIMLTGWGQRMVDDGERPANVDLVMSKPPRLSELRSAIASLAGEDPR